MGNEDEEIERIKKKKLQEMMDDTHQRERRMMVDTPILIADNTFDKIIQDNPLVVVDCWAPWCGPCRMVAPILEELAQDYSGKILFGKLNVDENQNVATRYQIMSIPTLLVFKDGNLVDRIVGAMPRNMLEPKLAQFL
jgi:thioredoxin 1